MTEYTDNVTSAPKSAYPIESRIGLNEKAEIMHQIQKFSEIGENEMNSLPIQLSQAERDAQDQAYISNFVELQEYNGHLSKMCARLRVQIEDLTVENDELKAEIHRNSGKKRPPLEAY